MRLMFTGATPWTNSGYGKPLRYLLPRLAEAGHECALAAFYGFQGATTMTNVRGQPVRLFGLARERFMNDIIEFHAASFDADVVISLQDVWTLEEWGKKPITWVPWMPVDCWPITETVRKAAEGCYAPASYSQWGRDQLIDAGFEDARYIPFGVDLDIHQPLPQGDSRAAIGIERDGFVAGMIAANSSFPSRKSFPEVLLAWKQWLDDGGEGLLYLHTTITPKREQGIDFQKLLSVMGLPWTTTDDPNAERKARAVVMFPSQHRMWCHAYDDQALAQVYNSLNLLLCPSMSEGFGIPIVEAQACGVPVITLKCTSMPELTFSGISLEPVQWYWHDQGGWRGIVGVKDLVEAIDWGCTMSKAPQGSVHYATKARASVMRFGWDQVVAEYWTPLLEELESVS